MSAPAPIAARPLCGTRGCANEVAAPGGKALRKCAACLLSGGAVYAKRREQMIAAIKRKRGGR